ncbi:MAG: SLC13 family permease [Verrucomicrobia bacterium]|nr:SLC13 family permease [Verrucomicrobiota bacterium]
MTADIASVLLIMAGAVGLFVSDRFRVDVVAVIVLLAFSFAGVIEPAKAVAGFSSPVVVTIGAIFVISFGLFRVGIASLLGRQILKLGKGGEKRLILAIMITAAVMSFFMNTLGIVALLLPAVMDIARRTGRAPSRLLMPLTFGALLGGLTTLFATLPNLLASNALRDNGFQPFGMFDFVPLGAAAAVAGILYMTFIGRHTLPVRDIQKESSSRDGAHWQEHYELHERMFVMRLPSHTPLAGKTLAESRLGSALGLHVVAVLSAEQTQLAPRSTTVLRAGDRLLVQGTTDQLGELESWRQLEIAEGPPEIDNWFPAEIDFSEARLCATSIYVDQTLAWIDLRQRFGVRVLAIRRGNAVRLSNLQAWRLEAGDVLLVHGLRTNLETLRNVEGLDEIRSLARSEVAALYHLEESLFTLRVPPDSALENRTLAQSRLGEALGLTVVAIERGETKLVMPGPDAILRVGDRLYAAGRSDDLLLLRAIQDLELNREAVPDFSKFESEQLGTGEAVLSPRTTLTGKSLWQLHFRERYGLNVLGIWREGKAVTTNLRNMTLRFGDAMLLYGPRDKLKLLGRDPDFVVLTESAQEPSLTNKIPAAAAAMILFLVPAILGWLPIYMYRYELSRGSGSEAFSN